MYRVLSHPVDDVYGHPPLLDEKSQSINLYIKYFSPNIQSISEFFTKNLEIIILYLLFIQPNLFYCFIPASTIG